MLNEAELSKLRTDYKGEEFKTGGCYVHQISDTVCRYYFFYKNGIRLELVDAVKIDSVNQFDLRGTKNSRGPWAIFSVVKNTITSTTWDMNEVSTFFITSVDTKKDYFKIENDSTISTIYTDNKIVYYHFQKFEPKPDSINRFIK